MTNKVFDKDGNKLAPEAKPDAMGLSTGDLKGKPHKDEKPAKGWVRVTMNKTQMGSIDGMKSTSFEEGQEYDLPLSLYKDFVSLEAVDAGLDKKEEKEKKLSPSGEKAHDKAPKNK
jgi:hypothetical protein